MLGPLMLAAASPVLRIDRAAATLYRELRARCTTTPQADFEAVANLMSCDVPAARSRPRSDDGARWGAIDRHYHACRIA